LFHSGESGVALCGVWQKTQMRVSVRARMLPRPLTDRLCLVSTMSFAAGADCAVAVPALKRQSRAMPARRTAATVVSRWTIRVPFRDAENLDASIVGVANVQPVVVTDEGSRGQPEFSEVDAALTDGQQELSLAIEQLNIVEESVDDIDRSIFVHRHPFR